jgi:hypothetical protein
MLGDRPTSGEFILAVRVQGKVARRTDEARYITGVTVPVDAGSALK